MFFQKMILGVAIVSAFAPSLAQTTMVSKQAIDTSHVNFTSKAELGEGVQNTFIIEGLSDYHLKFAVTLGNSDYDGYPGFLNQINSEGQVNIPISYFFFQWLNDNDFGFIGSGYFPDLNSFTKAGFWHEPFVFGTRLQTHMGSFGYWGDGYTTTAKNMIYAINDDFMTDAKNAYNKAIAPAGIQFNFDFSFGYNTFLHWVPYYKDNGHSWQVL